MVSGGDDDQYDEESGEYYGDEYYEGDQNYEEEGAPGLFLFIFLKG